MSFDLKKPTGPLDELLKCLDVAPELEENLRTIRRARAFEVEAPKLSACGDQLFELLDAYGAALETADGWSSLTPSGAATFELQPGRSEELKTFLNGIDPDHKVTVRLRVDKKKLIEAWLEAPAGTSLELIFDPGTLERLLGERLGERASWGLESWWGVAAEKLVIFVPAWSYFLDGPYLAIVGGDPVAGLERLGGRPRPAASSPAPPSSPPAAPETGDDGAARPVAEPGGAG